MMRMASEEERRVCGITEPALTRNGQGISRPPNEGTRHSYAYF